MFENILRTQSEVNMDVNQRELSWNWKNQVWLHIKWDLFKAQLGLYEKIKTDVGPQGLYGKMWKMWKTLSQNSVSNNNTIMIYLTPEIHLISSWHLSRDMVPLDREVFNLCFLSLWSELFPALWKPGHFNQFGWLSGTKFAGYHICPHLIFWPEAGACYENRSG